MRDPTTNTFCLQEYFSFKVVTTFSLGVRHRIDLVEDFDEFLSVLVMLGALYHNLALGSFSYFGRGYFSFDVYRFLNESAGILFDEHKFDNVEFLILYPVFIELFKNLPDFIDKLEDSLIALFFAYSLVRLFNVVQ